MQRPFLMEYWLDDDWYVGRLKDVPGVFSQGESLEELEENLREAYRMMRDEEEPAGQSAQVKELAIDVGE
jgi:predicted RNase H-like HicB family nuclease